MLRIRALVSPLIFTIACATGPSTSAPPGTGNPGDPGDPGDPNPGAPPTISTEQLATALGVSIVSSEPSGAPRLVRTIVPRPSAAGVPAAAAARDHIATLSVLWVRDAQPMALADNGVQQLRNGATLVKLVQNAGGVPVHGGELHVLLGADGGLAAISGTLLPAAAAATTPSFTSSATDALSHALDVHWGGARPHVTITETAASGDTGGWQPLQVASTSALQVDEARARRTLAQVGDQLVPAYEVEVQGTAAPDPLADPSIPTFSAHSYLVRDDGKILDDENLIANDAFVYRVYMETTGNRRPLDGALASFAPHPTGVPDGSAPSLLPQNLVVMDSFNKNLDPWLPTNATTTSGNNAEAFADLDGNRAFTPGDIRPVVKAGRVLNYVYDHTLEPLANTTQQSAAAVNTFFLVNWMHDWYYDSGFTEATANAQLDNFGRGGVANDPLRVDAQAGANVGSRNNANMGTPADGARPTMNMFLWTAGTLTGLAGPTGTPRTEPMAAGPRKFDLVADLAFATDGTAPNDDACETITSNVAGKIAIMNFSGVCGSLQTVNNAKAAGAIGVVLVDPALDNPRAFAGSAAANIPSIAMGKTDGAALEAALAAGPVTLEITSAVQGPERDGDLDNTVIAHEWGHYLHHRLENCGGAGSSQCGGMSEGWGDFNSLMMMAREGDNRDGVYAEGYYALADGVTPDFAYFGIRRYPYSRDHTKNDLSFRHISNGVALPTNTPGFPGDGSNNSEVHNTGEIWSAMMWEAYNVIADAHGVEVARRRMADYIVAGFLISPRNPSFTEQRDAILIAASAMDSDDMLVMAGAFASRGIGSCAVSPDKASAANAGVVESGTLAAKLAVGGLAVTDNGPRGDHDGILDPGESGTLSLTLANTGIIAAENVTVTATSAGVGVTLGKPLVIASQPNFSSSTLSIPISLAANAPVNTMVTISVHVAGQFTCDRNGIDASVTVLTGANPMMVNASRLVDEPLASVTEQSHVVSTVVAPATSLRAFDAACSAP